MKKRTYNFIDKDPIIDKLRTMIKQTGMSHQEVAIEAGLSHVTLYNWFYGDTKKPQFATVMCVVRACGNDIRFVSKAFKDNVIRLKRA